MYTYPHRYDVIVVGAGHAGVESALAAARIGCDTLLLALNLDAIGQMSCNPAIGGLAKGNLVREIDALGGEMGINADMTGLQFRMLNRRKGAAVWAPRAQCDKKAYQFRLKGVCEKQPNLTCKQAHVTRFVLRGMDIGGVETSMGVRFLGKCVIVTAGTFLHGLIHVGVHRTSGGRAGDPATHDLSDSLRGIGIELGRLKTGTPPRLLKRSIDFGGMVRQSGDWPIPYFSFWNHGVFHVEQTSNSKSGCSPYPIGSIIATLGGQLPCFLTHTTSATGDLIRENLHKSAMYSGNISGVGPRYCPSIEDKFVRFSGKEQHQIFLEPEGIATDEIYVNGLSTSLPYDVQVDLVRSIAGCENAEIMRQAYAVEYDFALPTQLNHSLESRLCRNLFLAGQINGTSGYEEAAAQGLMAGINAAMRVKEKPPVILGRDQAYIGVLIDDLVTKGTTEPYRMFTSRAEYRLLLRQDNADLRLSEIGYAAGLLSESKFQSVARKRKAIEEEIGRLKKAQCGSSNLEQLLRRPEISINDTRIRNRTLEPDISLQVELTVKYSGYVDRQEAEIRKRVGVESKEIPVAFDYNGIQGLRSEALQKLLQHQPMTIGQASRISGVTPADIALLLIHLKRGE